MRRRAFSIEAWVSKESRASTSVDTRPGTMLSISRPNRTERRSAASVSWRSRLLLGDLAGVLGKAGGLLELRRIGGRVLRLVFFHGVDVARVGHDGGDLAELF